MKSGGCFASPLGGHGIRGGQEDTLTGKEPGKGNSWVGNITLKKILLARRDWVFSTSEGTRKMTVPSRARGGGGHRVK